MLELSSKYKTLKDFKLDNINAYQFAVKHKFVDELGLIKAIAPSSYWTDDRIKEEASKFESISEFAKGSDKAYRIALKKDMIGSLFNSRKIKFRFWTEDNIRKYAKEFKTIKEYSQKYTSAVQAARKLGIIDDLGLERIGSIYKRCIYSIEFSNKHIYIGLTCNFERRKFEHLNCINSRINKYIVANPDLTYKMVKLTDYVEKDYAVKLEGEVLLDYLNKGFVALNIKKTGGLGGNLKKDITNDGLIEISKKYKTRFELINSKDKFAYRLLSQRKLLHLVNFEKPKSKKKWIPKYILIIMSKYNTMNDFKKNEKLAWKHANNLNMIKTITTYELTNKPEWL